MEVFTTEQDRTYFFTEVGKHWYEEYEYIVPRRNWEGVLPEALEDIRQWAPKLAKRLENSDLCGLYIEEAENVGIIEEVTPFCIKKLRDEARKAGDTDIVEICEASLDGNVGSTEYLAEIIAAAEAMDNAY